MPFCPNCGNGISTEEKFCSQCGQKIKVPAARPTTAATPVTPAPPTVQVPSRDPQRPQTHQPPVPAPQVRPPTVQQGPSRPTQVPIIQPKWVKEGIRGTVRGVQKGAIFIGNETFDELTFTLERVDDAGNIIEIIPIQAKFKRADTSGLIRDGVTVVVLGSEDKSGGIFARKLYNESADYEYKLASKGAGWYSLGASWIFILLVAIILLVIFFIFVQAALHIP